MAALFVLCIGTYAYAQSPSPNPDRGKGMHEKASAKWYDTVKSTLGLTDDQVQKLKDADSKYREASKKNFENFKNGIKPVLTPDQQAILEKKKTGDRSYPFASGTGQSGDRLIPFLQDLKATDAQKKQLTTIFNDNAGKMKESISAYTEDLKKILKPEQVSQFLELKKTMRDHMKPPSKDKQTPDGSKPPNK